MTGERMDPHTDDWFTQANCLGVDTQLFYTERGENTAQARAVCTGCTVRTQCLDYALDHREIFGIWGGTSERERRAIRRQTKQVAS